MIVSGRYLPGDKIPPVRELALEAQVNPNTMQKALGELEREGLLYTQRTSGRFVTSDSRKISELKKKLAADRTKEYLALMEGLGYSQKEIIEFAQSIIKGDD